MKQLFLDKPDQPTIERTPVGQTILEVSTQVMSILATQGKSVHTSKKSLQQMAIYSFDVAEALVTEEIKRYGTGISPRIVNNINKGVGK